MALIGVQPLVGTRPTQNKANSQVRLQRTPYSIGSLTENEVAAQVTVTDGGHFIPSEKNCLQPHADISAQQQLNLNIEQKGDLSVTEMLYCVKRPNVTDVININLSLFKESINGTAQGLADKFNTLTAKFFGDGNTTVTVQDQTISVPTEQIQGDNPQTCLHLETKKMADTSLVFKVNQKPIGTITQMAKKLEILFSNNKKVLGAATLSRFYLEKSGERLWAMFKLNPGNSQIMDIAASSSRVGSESLCDPTVHNPDLTPLIGGLAATFGAATALCMGWCIYNYQNQGAAPPAPPAPVAIETNPASEPQVPESQAAEAA